MLAGCLMSLSHYVWFAPSNRARSVGRRRRDQDGVRTAEIVRADDGSVGVRFLRSFIAFFTNGQDTARPSSTTGSTWLLQRRWATGWGRAWRTGTSATRMGRRVTSARPSSTTGSTKGGGRPGGRGRGVLEPRQRV